LESVDVDVDTWKLLSLLLLGVPKQLLIQYHLESISISIPSSQEIMTGQGALRESCDDAVRVVMLAVGPLLSSFGLVSFGLVDGCDSIIGSVHTIRQELGDNIHASCFSGKRTIVYGENIRRHRFVPLLLSWRST
jgi:hypothetical protein